MLVFCSVPFNLVPSRIQGMIQLQQRMDPEHSVISVLTSESSCERTQKCAVADRKELFIYSSHYKPTISLYFEIDYVRLALNIISKNLRFS